MSQIKLNYSQMRISFAWKLLKNFSHQIDMRISTKNLASQSK